MSLYATELGQNAYFIENGKIMATRDGYIRESILSIEDFNEAIRKGYLFEVEPRNPYEAELVKAMKADRNLEFGLVLAGVVVVTVGIIFAAMMG